MTGLRTARIEMQQREHCEDNAVECLSHNMSLPNCDVSGSNLSSAFEVPVSMELQRNDVDNISGMTSDIPDESDLVGKSNTQISSAQKYDKVSMMSGQQRSTVPRVCASGGRQQAVDESVATYWTAQVPPSTDQPCGFR